MVALFNVKVPPCRVDQVNVQKSTIPGCLQTFTCHPAVWNGERLRSRPSGGVVQRDIEKSRVHETNKQNKTTSKEPFKALRRSAEGIGAWRAPQLGWGANSPLPGCATALSKGYYFNFIIERRRRLHGPRGMTCEENVSVCKRCKSTPPWWHFLTLCTFTRHGGLATLKSSTHMVEF